MKQQKKYLIRSLVLLGAFGLWTLAVCRIDLQPIGPGGSVVGFAAMNRFFHQFTGVHMGLYVLTDWLGLVPLVVVLVFGILGLAQWISRKHILKVDRSLLVLGIFYILTLAAYLLFEDAVINYRPVLIAGNLEASYPSSTTLLVLCVMPTAYFQLRHRIPRLKKVALGTIAGFMVFMVMGRLISGVHWLSDIVGGLLLSAGLVEMYRFFGD